MIRKSYLLLSILVLLTVIQDGNSCSWPTGQNYDSNEACTWPQCQFHFTYICNQQCISDPNSPYADYYVSCSAPNGDNFDIQLFSSQTYAGGSSDKTLFVSGSGFSFCAMNRNGYEHATVNCDIFGPPGGPPSPPQLLATTLQPDLPNGLIQISSAGRDIGVNSGHGWTHYVISSGYTFSVTLKKQVSPQIQIRAAYSNSYGTGVWSSSLTVPNFGTVPSSPISVNTIQTNQIESEIIWTLPEDDGGAPILNYIVSVQSSLDSSVIFSGQVGYAPCHGCSATPPFLVSGLSPSISYTVSVVATNSMGQSAPSKLTFSATPAGCTPSCNNGTSMCGAPCTGTNNCTCACAVGWGTTPDDPTCSHVAPYLQRQLYDALDGIITGSKNSSYIVQELNETLLAPAMVSQSRLSTNTLALARTLKCTMNNLNNGFDFLGQSSNYVSHNQWTDFDTLLSQRVQDLSAIQSSINSLFVANVDTNVMLAVASTSAGNLGIQIANANLDLANSQNRAAAISSSLVLSYSKLQNQYVAFKDSMTSFVANQQSQLTNMYDTIRKEIQTDERNAVLSISVDIVKIAVSVVSSVASGGLSSLGGLVSFGIANGGDLFSEGKDIFNQLSGIANGFSGDPLISNAHDQITAIQSSIQNSQEVYGCALELSSIMTSVEFCVTSQSCSVNLSVTLPQLFAATIDASNVRNVLNVFVQSFSASTQGQSLTINLNNYVDIVEAHIMLIKQWNSELSNQQTLLGRVASLQAQQKRVGSLVAMDSQVIATLESAKNATMLQLQAVWFDSLKSAYLLQRQLTYTTLTPGGGVSVPTGQVSPYVTGLILGLTSFQSAARTSYTAYQSNVASSGSSACWVQVLVNLSDVAQLVSTGSAVVQVPIPSTTSYYNVRLAGKGVQAVLASSNPVETHLLLTQLGRSSVYDSNFQRWDYVHDPQSYIFQYAADGTPLTTSDTTVVDSTRPGLSPYGLWKIEVTSPALSQLTTVTGITLQFYVTFQSSSRYSPEVSVWGGMSGVSCISIAPSTSSCPSSCGVNGVCVQSHCVCSFPYGNSGCATNKVTCQSSGTCGNVQNNTFAGASVSLASKNRNLVPISIGVVGGVLLLAVFGIIFYRRKRVQSSHANLDPIQSSHAGLDPI